MPHLLPLSLLPSPPPPLPSPLSSPPTGFHKQYQLTLVTVEKSNSQSGDYLAKVLKQKLFVSALQCRLGPSRCAPVSVLLRGGTASAHAVPRLAGTMLHAVASCVHSCVVSSGVCAWQERSERATCLLSAPHSQADNMEVLLQEIYGLENKKVWYLVGWAWHLVKWAWHLRSRIS